eukprot:CAMPEP_0176432630 /NCGR_PEP_ID=MMETSP0127-20121128/15504_1 /TAXON_ID=938130 /ORGANISM="Platyophrya macrostoma, Strain WH" /LENGTH=562 /DNA_ID=CAMNT_0017814829 /DNA_START=19 /DNA_END=1707 /DNA_ORIENTATION=-
MDANWVSLINDLSVEKVCWVAKQYYHIFKVIVRRTTESYVIRLDYIDIVVIWTVILLCTLYVLRKLCYMTSDEYRQDCKRRSIKFVKNLPIIRTKIQKEFAKIEVEINKSTDSLRSSKTYHLPTKGMKSSTVKEKIENNIKREKENFKHHRVHGTMYYSDKKDVANLVKDVCKEFLYHNPLHYDLFPTSTQMEAEVINMTANLYHGEKKAVGITTSGGTESILMAILTYRDWARDTKGIKKPELVATKSAHVAFEKACHYFGVKYVTVDVNPKTGLPAFGDIKNAINKNTIALVASCPSFPYGAIDDVNRFSNLALRHGIGLHVDCCLGGFMAPFAKDNNVTIPAFDFSVKGVTTISVDHHKFGQAPKGISVLLFRDKSWRKYAIYATAKWPGGIYATPTMAGSRSSAPIAGAWAAMMYYGMEGYIAQAKSVLDAAATLVAGIKEEIPELSVIGNPKLSLVAFTSNRRNLDIYSVYDKLVKKGWKVGALQKPAGINLSITPFNAGTMEELIADLKEAVKQVLDNPKEKKSGMAVIYGTAQSMPAQFVEEGAVIGIEAMLNLL